MTYRQMFKEKRYHVNKGFPQDVLSLLEKATDSKYVMHLEYTRHATEQAVKYGCREGLPDRITWNKCYIFEVATVKGVLDKVVLRTSFDKDYDIILAVNADNSRVRTLWIAEKDDTRSETVDLANYDTP